MLHLFHLARAEEAPPSDADTIREAEALAAEPASPPLPQAPARAAFNALNPGLTAFGDLVGQLGLRDGAVAPGSTLYLRSVELELRADVDPFAKATAVIAFEQEAPPLEGGPGEGFGAGPEEAYVDLVALPARLSARIGQFKAPFGIVNRMHPHDLPWTDAPGLLGEEGYNDAGASLSWIAPLGPAGLTVTAAGFAGQPFDEDNESAGAAGLGRGELFVNAGSVDVSLGGSALGDLVSGTTVYGGDMMLRFRPSTRQSLVLSAEVVRTADLAGYGAMQIQPGRNVYIGVREDFGPDGLRHNLFLSYYTSEFLRVRAGGGYAQDTGDVDVLAQLTFVWGSHPVEPWWVNR